MLEWTGVAEGRWVGGEGVILYCDGKVNVTPDVVGVAVSFWQSSCSYTSTVNVLKTKSPIQYYGIESHLLSVSTIACLGQTDLSKQNLSLLRFSQNTGLSTVF